MATESWYETLDSLPMAMPSGALDEEEVPIAMVSVEVADDPAPKAIRVDIMINSW